MSPELPDLNVLVLIDHLALGGAEMLLGQFAAAAPLARIAVSVSCLVERDGNPAAAPLRALGIEPLDLDLPGRPSMRSLLAVRSHFKQRMPDIVHTHLGDADLVGGIAARSLSIPCLCTIHGIEWPHDLQTPVRRRLIKHCCDRVIAVSEDARRVYMERGWAQPGQVTVVPNGVDASPQPGAGAEVRAEFGWTPDHLVVGMVSALRPIKAHDVAIAAVARLREQFPTLRLLIVGDGPARKDVARMVADAGDFVAMAGGRADVMRCFDALDVCLQPSRAEAFPTSLIEAMAASVPAVATAVGGIPEIVIDGQTGLLVPAPPDPRSVASALETLLGDPDRRRQMGENARARYERSFTAEPWIRSTRQVYDDVLRERGLTGTRLGP